MIEIYAKEYVAIVGHLLKKDTGILKEKNGQLAVNKSEVLPLLEKNLYAEPAEKLRLWKGLKWIQTDGRHTTQKVYVDSEEGRKRMLVFDLKVYEILAQKTP